jgi:GH25 family lysozyme M1 (1,4-beta-N-acetylmuramidase)
VSLVQIIDISNHQGAVDFAKVKASGMRAIICKATEGTTFVDPWFYRNWAGIKSAGLIRGAYHFGRPKFVATAQAEHFVRTVGPLMGGDLPYALDIEVDDGQGPAAIEVWVGAFVRRMVELTGRKPIIYTGPGFWNGKVRSKLFGSHPLWVAHYTTRPAPQIPTGWDRWHIWQHSSDGTVPGIKGRVDVNRVEEGVLLALAGRVTEAGVDIPGEVIVPAKYNPPIVVEPVVDDLACPTGGAWTLAASGAVNAWGGAPYIDAPNRHPEYWGSRKAARLEACGNGYTVVAASGERYEYRK